MEINANRGRHFNWIWIASLWTGLGVFDATQNVFSMLHAGMHHSWVKLFFVLTFNRRIFCRIHRSTIVNLRRVRALKIDGAGEYEVVLEGGQKLRLSRRFRKDLQARMRER